MAKRNFGVRHKALNAFSTDQRMLVLALLLTLTAALTQWLPALLRVLVGMALRAAFGVRGFCEKLATINTPASTRDRQFLSGSAAWWGPRFAQATATHAPTLLDRPVI